MDGGAAGSGRCRMQFPVGVSPLLTFSSRSSRKQGKTATGRREPYWDRFWVGWDVERTFI